MYALLPQALVVAVALLGLPAAGASEIPRERGHLGVEVEKASIKRPDGPLDGSVPFGVRIIQLAPDAPAAIAGIVPGDVILKVDDQAIFGSENFTSIIGFRGPGSQVRLQILRDDAERTVVATLGARVRRPSFLRTSRGDTIPDAAYQNFQFLMESEASEMLARSVSALATDGPLAALLRERSALQAKRLAIDKQTQEIKLDEYDKALLEALKGLNHQKRAIDRRLAEEYPEYKPLVQTERVTLSDTQAILNDDEVLVMLVDMSSLRRLPAADLQDVILMVVTKSEVAWGSLDLQSTEISTAVEVLRCGLDYQGAWFGNQFQRCNSVFKPNPLPNGSNKLPFDVARAHDLYEALFSEVEDLIKAKHLLIMASGPVTALPFHVLVTERPAIAVPADPGTLANVPWLIKRQPITIIPSVGSLKALRQQAKSSRATNPFIGFGNPLLAGENGKDRRAWRHQRCPTARRGTAHAFGGKAASIATLGARGRADVEQIRRQPPLPETTDELCAVAHTLGARDTAVYLGARATERVIKGFSADGTLANSRVVHFATHGLLAYETEGLGQSAAEPALMLTPPEKATAEDDGLLTVSEIMQLKLDADWVVLSACNTASGEKQGAEAFSGLARAFFAVGARALLVSHWYVDSDAAVKLTTATFNILRSDATIGRSEALRRSMLTLMAKGGNNAHPANWAPFVVVGEGGTILKPMSLVPAPKIHSTSTVSAPDALKKRNLDALPARAVPRTRTPKRQQPAVDASWQNSLGGQ